MIRFLLAVTVLTYAITPIALSADEPGNVRPAQPAASRSAPANLAPIYIKIIWPDDPATPATENDQPNIESWITKSIEKRNKGNFRAVTGWVPLALGPFDATDLWDGRLDGAHCTCIVGADVFERRDGSMKIRINGWSPGGDHVIATLKDEPGSREVVPVTQAKKKHGVPHVAIFIGLPVD